MAHVYPLVEPVHWPVRYCPTLHLRLSHTLHVYPSESVEHDPARYWPGSHAEFLHGTHLYPLLLPPQDPIFMQIFIYIILYI